MALAASAQDDTNSPAYRVWTAQKASATNDVAVATNEVAVIKTTEGTMVAEFWTDAAPETIANFKKLARSGFYDGTCFHRVIKGFMIQGGDPNTKGKEESTWGMGDPGYKIKAEFNDHLHVRGVLSMARSNFLSSIPWAFRLLISRCRRVSSG